jgi:2-methylcitrate dehydratase PrpD
LCREIAIERLPGDAAKRSGWASEVTIRLRDGRELEAAADDFKGTPTLPMSAQELRGKFLRCAGGYAHAESLLAQLEAIALLADVRELELG